MSDSLPKIDPHAMSSQQYIEKLNLVADDLDYETFITFKGDQKGGQNNVPELFIGNKFSGEVEVSAAFLIKYGVQDVRHLRRAREARSILEAAIDHTRAELEKRRQEVGQFIYTRMTSDLSPSYGAVLETLTPAKRAWFEAVKDPITEESLDIYGKQVHPEYELNEAYMVSEADLYSKLHFARVRETQANWLPSHIIPYGYESAAEAREYDSVLPWFPDLPSMESAMWPLDMIQEEFAYLTKTYDPQHPILQPYTVVERATPKEVERIQAIAQTNRYGEPMEWIVEGLEGRKYKVTNIAFHPRFRPHFLKVAQVLRENADIEMDGDRLDPSFKEYTLVMADAFENGQFEKLLAADMAQTSGNLFFTFFPHEGYWADNTKFPWMMEIGIRDGAFQDEAFVHAQAFQWLEEKTASIIQSTGLSYEPRLMNLEEQAKSSEFLWVLRTGGFLRAFRYGDAAGHDYPKRLYPNITGHKTVVILDAIKPGESNRIKLIKKLLGPEASGYVSFDGSVWQTSDHENTHGVGIRADDVTMTEETFAVAFGDYWGVHSEPYADAGAILIANKLREDEKISEEEFKAGVMEFLYYEMVQFLPKEFALVEEQQRQNPHETGASLLIGWLAKEKVLYKNMATGYFELDWGKFVSSVDQFYTVMTEHAARGDLEEFKAFLNEQIEVIPDELSKVKEELNKESIHSVNLVNRGDLYGVEE